MFKTSSPSHVADDRFSDTSLSWFATMNLGLVQFAQSHGVTLGETTLERITSGHPGYTIEKAKRFVLFQERVNRELLRHRILLRNPYFAWFRRGEMTTNQLRGFVSQFSVFSNLFLLALTKRTIEAESVMVMRATKEILMNELGVCYRPKKVEQMAEGSGVIVVSGEGSVEGGRYWHAAAHYEWLVDVGAALGLSFEDLGRPCFGNPATLHFGNELLRLYGSSNEQVAMASSYAVEQTGLADFWEPLIEGIKGYNERHGQDTPVPLGYFEWHHQVEGQHVGHAQDELEEYYFSTELDEDCFMTAGQETFEAIALFWEGLDEMRQLFD